MKMVHQKKREGKKRGGVIIFFFGDDRVVSAGEIPRKVSRKSGHFVNEDASTRTSAK